MAVHTGLELSLDSVISICGDLPYNINYDYKANTPIYWFEGGKDSYINKPRKESYKILGNIKTDLCYKILSSSTHNEFAEDLLCEIKKDWLGKLKLLIVFNFYYGRKIIYYFFVFWAIYIMVINNSAGLQVRIHGYCSQIFEAHAF